MTILRELISNLTTTRIILDGIDEWDLSLQEELLRSLVELQRHSGDSCKLLVSSRQEPQIDKAMQKKTEFPLEGNTAGGLQEYIHERVKELKDAFPGLEPELIHRVELRLRQMAKGMFLWVRLVTSMLQQQVSELDFEEAIEKLPDGLEQAYGRILSRIEDLKPDLKDRAFRILFWLCATFRPIKVHEVADGLALRPGKTVLNRKTRFQDTKRDIVDFCAPMVERVDNGILSLVHFSAKQYILDPQSGPFLAIAQAHFDIAFSCVTNLISASNIVPRFSSPNSGMTELDIEASIVQGSYGLQEYGHRFWAEHVREYARLVQSPDNQTTILAGALKAFRVVQKGHSGDEVLQGTGLQLYTSAEQLPGLAEFPALQAFVNKWLNFRSELDKMGVDFENLDAQNQWQLQKDETYLTLISHRLREVTEGLLALDRSNLPCHIQAGDYADFIGRFGFNCRFHGCTHCFDTARSRDTHEATHTPSFPCLQCDFSGRGFRTRRDLKRHVQKYHMSIEEFEIPTSLRMAGCSSYTSRFGASQYQGSPVQASKCWNERGRDILRKSFQQALDKIESVKTYASETPKDPMIESEHASDNTTPTITLNEVREKVAQNGYETLLDFRNDLQSIASNQTVEDSSENLEKLNMVVDQEIKMVLNSFPDFANFPLKTPGGWQPEAGQHINTSQTIESVNEETGAMNPSVSAARVPYWSAAERREIPKLLEQFGSNYAKLSSYLNTKTPEEIEHYFLQLLGSGEDHLASQLESADAGSGSPWNTDESDSMIEADVLSTVLPEDSSQESSSPGAQGSIQQHENAIPGQMPPETFGSTQHHHSHKERFALKNKPPTAVTGHIIGAPKRRKLVRPKKYCPVCTSHALFSTDSALTLHHTRFHSSTRKYWVCNDASIEKVFFADCTACSTVKRYRSKHNAYTHLRRAHFPLKSPLATLERWIKELEEANPAYKNLESGAEVARDPDTSPIRKIPRMPKPPGGPQLKRLADVLKELDLHQMLPSPPGKQSNNGQSNPSTEDAGQGLNHNDPAKPRRDVLLQSVTFEQILGASTTRSIQQNSSSAGNSRSELASDPRRALIRSDQVAKLPHLTEYHKVICQDQVDALNHVLDTTPAISKAYKDAFKKLETLSCTILENLRDRRRQLALAPNIPFSV